jgi:hypothetical protein
MFVSATGRGCRITQCTGILTACTGASGAPLEIRPLAVAPGVSRPFASYFGSFVAQAPHLSGAAVEIAIDTLLQLALAARGLTSPKAEPTHDALRAGQLEAARQFITREMRGAS